PRNRELYLHGGAPPPEELTAIVGSHTISDCSAGKIHKGASVAADASRHAYVNVDLSGLVRPVSARHLCVCSDHVALLPGDYCGGNGSGDPSILYSCSGNSVVRAVSCVKGCQFNTVPGSPPVPPPGCSGGGSGSCVSLPVGDYCGDDLVCGDPNV